MIFFVNSHESTIQRRLMSLRVCLLCEIKVSGFFFKFNTKKYTIDTVWEDEAIEF